MLTSASASSTPPPAAAGTPPLALRPRYAARCLDVSPRTLWAWTEQGTVPCVRLGTGKRKTVLYPVADLRAWLSVRAAEGGVQ